MALLLTSFAPWKAHQNTNTSDDLVAALAAQNRLPNNTILIRRLPVHFQLAPCRVLSAVVTQRPSLVICCGMAESRSVLSLERYARYQDQILETSIDLEWLCQKTQLTKISEDAGDYVCNDLYYRLLAYVQKHHLSTQCLFVHVPALTYYSRYFIVNDLAIILNQLDNASLELAVA